jgi:hypothetical protein
MAIMIMKKTIFSSIAALAFIAYAGIASADEAVSATGNWAAPTVYTDGTQIEPGDIVEYRVYTSIDGAISDDPESAHTKVTSGTTQVIELSLKPRPTPYVLTMGVRAVTSNGGISDLSNLISKSFAVKTSAKPNAPTSVQFNITCSSGCVITPIEAP